MPFARVSLACFANKFDCFSRQVVLLRADRTSELRLLFTDAGLLPPRFVEAHEVAAARAAGLWALVRLARPNQMRSSLRIGALHS